MERLRELQQKYLLVPKSLYFSFALVIYAMHQYKGQFIMHQCKDIDKGSLSVYLSFVQMISFTSSIFIAMMNDKFGNQKYILIALFTASAAMFQSLYSAHSVFALMGIYAIYFSSISALLPLLDKVVLEYLNNIPGISSAAYGKQRLWGSFGFLATNFIIEQIATVEAKKFEFTNVAFYNVIVTVIAIALVFLFIKNIAGRSMQGNVFSCISKLLGNLEFSIFLFIILLCGITRCSMTTYLSIYYTDVLKFVKEDSPYDLPGPLNPIVNFFYKHKLATTTLFGNALEIAIFFKSQAIIERFGLFFPLFAAQFAQLARFGAYYMLDIDSPNVFLYACLIELLKGVNFSLIQCSAALLVSKLVPPQYKTTAQILYNGSFIALGSVLSGIISSFQFDPKAKMSRSKAHSEFRGVFKTNILLTLAIIGFFLVKYALIEKVLFNKNNADEKLKQIEEENAEEVVVDKLVK
ncbi:hypothetical protein ENBRE01_0967 [Enteropsectra breve]|nr:hypothetical protein ENBRE01_0967 [Enteropsectra breve]